MSTSPWLDQAWRSFGERERAGSADNPRILAFYRDVGHSGVAHDETAWCAAFVGAMLERAGIRSTRSLMARSYAEWGQPAPSGDSFGAIAVLRRGADPSLGHVGFLLAETPDGLILLGGNQGDAVSVARFDKSRLVALRWPRAPGLAASGSAMTADQMPADTRFDSALAHVLKMEGGYTDDPADPGGPTNRGITLAEFAAWRNVRRDGALTALKGELQRIPMDEVRAIYVRNYWQAASCDRLPAGLDLMHFDAAVNQGVGTAIRLLQRAVDVTADGAFGPLTAAAASATPVRDVLRRYADLRCDRYRALAGFPRFGRGWLARVDTTLARGLARAAPSPVPSATRAHNEASMSDTAAAIAHPKSVQDAPVEETPAAAVPAADRWWGRSMTVWGTLLTAVSTVLPVLAPLFGFEISPDMVREIGGQAAQVLQGLAGVAGTVMAIYGRTRAVQPLVRKPVSLRL